MGRTARNNYFLRALLVVLAAAVVAAGLLALVGAKQAWAEGLSFSPGHYFKVGDATPTITADLNSDGKVDLAAPKVDSAYVSVLFGNGDGTFQAKQDFAVGGKPSSVASADFNSDGKTDLATANLTSGNISILLSNGDGTFQTAQDSALGITDSYSGGYDTVTSTDFNGDNKADLATASYGSDSVLVLLGKGDGTFEAVQSFSVGDTPVSVASADFNGDDEADLVTANNPFSSSDPNSVSVLLGKGDGTFEDASNIDAASGPDQVITADFNGDHKADLATASWGSIWTGGGSVSVYLGNGDGKFQAPFNVVEDAEHHAYHPSSVTATDFDHDGNVDLAATDENGFGDPSDALVLLGYGDGTFQNPQNFAVEQYPGFIISTDLNADSYADLTVAGMHPRASTYDPHIRWVSVLLNIPAPEDTTAPTVAYVYPEEEATYAPPWDNVEATFSEAMDRSTLTPTSFTLSKQGSSTPVAAQVSYTAAYQTATLNPDADLEENATYTATVKGESSGTEDVVKDAFGKALATDKTWSFTVVDATAPAAPSKPDLDTASDKGSSTSDDITNINKPTFTGSPGSAESGSTVKIYVDGVEKGSATAATDGSYSVETTSTLADGAHRATATATDTTGNTSGESPALSFTIDTNAPVATAPVHSYAVSSAVASAASDSTVPVELTWSGTDSGSSITKYELQQSLDGGGTFATVTSPTSTSLSQQLKPGTTLYRFQVRAEDKAGNTGAFAAGSAFKVTSYQETPTSTVRYPAGTWTAQSVGDAYGGSLRYASAKGAKATFSVPAGSKNVAWVAPKASNRGKADVYLDGVFQKTVDLYSANPLARQIVFSKAVSPTISHTLEVRVLGTQQSASTAKRVDVDAFLATG